KLNIANPSDSSQMKLQAEMIGSGLSAAQKMMEAIRIFQSVGYRDPLFRLQNLIRKANLGLVPDFIRFCRYNGLLVDLELMASGEATDQKYFEVAPSPQDIANLLKLLEQEGIDYMRSSAMAMDDGLWPEFSFPTKKFLMPHLFGSCPFYDKGLYFAVDGHIRACSNSTVVLA
ncbi:MAG: hypothetical protein HY980_02500, partial [Candidatus Magasanikbacteria bacterium]|nr:hypothetical protein [Candidatus Magasanikbacteria bacterium]